MKKTQPLISVCIPVFETESFLDPCLRSVIMQDFPSFEIIVVSDASDGRDNKGRNAKKIIGLINKECKKIRKAKKLPKVAIKFIEHSENRGLIEVRRSLCYEARGLYVFQLDSDDELEKGALSALYSNSDGCDIVHGSSVAGVFDDKGCFIPGENNVYGQIFYGKLENHQIFSNWLIDKKMTSNTWGKLIKRELFLKIFEMIPYTECNLAEDFLLFFFISQFAKSYIGIRDKVYRYRIDSGMTSRRTIDSIKKWKMICSCSSVFTIISDWIKKNPEKLQTEEIEKIRTMSRYYLKNNLIQLQKTVTPALQPQAYEILCEYWGKDYVEAIEKLMEENQKPTQ